MKIRNFLFLGLMGLFIISLTHSVYFNVITHSLPYGIYVRTKDVPRINEYAATCLTSDIADYGIKMNYLARGNCDTGSVLVLKKIMGLPGDHFLVDKGSLLINNKAYPIMSHDSSGRSLKNFYHQKRGVIDKNKYMLLSDFVNNSWDGRYWGPVSIQFVLKPLFIFENVKS